MATTTPKASTIKLTGPHRVSPGMRVQTHIRAEALERFKRDGRDVATLDHRDMAAATAADMAERRGYIVASCTNTLDVEPGTMLGRADVDALIDGPHAVTVTAPKPPAAMVAETVGAWEALAEDAPALLLLKRQAC